MKVVTILGTRPEIIRLSRIIPKLDALCEHRLVHTGQNYDASLNDIFFEQLGVRAPDHHLGITSGRFASQMGQMLPAVDDVLDSERPDAVLILGDTNSGLCAVLAKRRGIPVYHMEAGNRCYDDRVPEEVNRRIIDHSSDVLMPYTERSRQNLLREGIDGDRIYVTGNPILEVIRHHEQDIAASDALARLDLKRGGYFLVTMHRAENVDVESRLTNLVTALRQLAEQHGLPIIVSTHPRTRARMQEFNVDGRSHRLLQFLDPLGFFDFVSLERQARCVISDSGTVQEECAIFGMPNVTIRDTTERPETLECGSALLSGVHAPRIVSSVAAVMQLTPSWTAPPEYQVQHVSDTVVKIVLTYRGGCGPARKS
jgi:UDP-N-acetylglucosamine 2-epimerase (non-hydrolysing)